MSKQKVGFAKWHILRWTDQPQFERKLPGAS